MPVIGVGGGIASGKTTLCKLFEKWGAHIIDADLIGKEVVERNPRLLHELTSAFGDDILNEDGSLNRRKLGTIVFQDPQAREKLNRTVHPPLLAELTEQVNEWRKKNPMAIIVVDAALLLEWELNSLLDTLIVVEADEKTRLKRLINSAGLSPEEARARITAQSGFKAKSRLADHVITNDSSFEDLENQAKKTWKHFVAEQDN